MRSLKFLLCFCVSLFLLTSVALADSQTDISVDTHYVPGKRAQLPPEFDDTYLGFGAGYTDIPYSNSDLINGLKANHFTNPNSGLNVFVGHFFTPHWALEASLMRPIAWAYANDIAYPGDRHSIWVSLFGIDVRPTLPVTPRLSVYAQAGVGVISRHGFSINGVTASPSTDLLTELTGAGFTYALTPHWHLNLGVEYALPQPSVNQPKILYTYAGFYYLFHTLSLPAYYTTHYIFQKNMLQFGGFSTKDFDPDINKYFTVGYVPIFWTGNIHLQSGQIVSYERNIFHTHKVFSFDIGTSISNYYSSVNDTNFQVFSVFPDIRLWFFRSRLADFYFMYSVAGPSYITRRIIDNINSGGNFTFQDLMGLGMFIGRDKHLNINFGIGHYSNGNVLPNNPGIQVPFTISAGYAF